MAAKALLVLSLFSAAGDPSFPPTVTEQPTMAACQAMAKTAVEALAAIHAEKVMPTPLKSGSFAAVEERGVWVVRYDRQQRADPEKGEPVISRMIRAACRPIGD